MQIDLQKLRFKRQEVCENPGYTGKGTKHKFFLTSFQTRDQNRLKITQAAYLSLRPTAPCLLIGLFATLI